MWRELYPQWCLENNYNPVSLHVYRDVFNTEFNLGFHKPKKDQCLTCAKFNNLTGAEKEDFRPIHEAHIERKVESQDAKNEDKKCAEEDQSYKAITFDLQAVLFTPFTEVSLLFYKRKLAVYNLTVYEQAGRLGFCYLWPETNGKRGANEIATCLLKYFSSLPEHVKHVTSFSDTCSGQNRNIFVAAAMVYAVSTSDNLETIDMKFLESGHSMMEVDSVHAAIETKRKHQKVYNTHEWGMICTATRERNPYTVTELEFTDFMDFHKLVEETVVNRNKSISGQNVNWLKLKWLRFIKAKPNSILVKERLTDDEFQEIVVNQSVGRRESTRIRQSTNGCQPGEAVLEPAYSTPRCCTFLWQRNKIWSIW